MLSLLASQSIMKQKTEKLSKKNSMCRLRADRIYATNPTLKEIEDTLFKLWDAAYSEGWEDNTRFQKKLRDNTERILKQGFDEVRTKVEDTIYKNK